MVHGWVKSRKGTKPVCLSQELNTLMFGAVGRFLCIFQTEVHAIDICARANVDREYNRENIAIMWDSQTAIRALNSPVIRLRMIWECWKRLNLLGRSNNVTVTGRLNTWVYTGVKKLMSFQGKGNQPEPHRALSNWFCKEELKTLSATSRNRLWRCTERKRHS